MQVQLSTRAATLALIFAGLACARNTASDDRAAAATDTTTANQTESGVTDSSGQSTLGPGVEHTRPDQGQPVTSKGDTVNMGVDSARTGQPGASQDSIGTDQADSAAANQTESGVTDSSGQSTLGPEVEKTRPDQGQPVTSKGDTVNMGVDSSATAR